MRGSLPTLARVSHVRVVRADRRVAEAAAELRLGEQALARAQDQVDEARAAADCASGELRERPQCEQRRFLFAARSEQLARGETSLRNAQLLREEATERLRMARQQQRRTELRKEVVAGRLASARREEHERAAEREGEDRWTHPQTA